VFCISNHDQCGNRASGERLNHLISPEAYRAASALLCLVPYTPLIFMGQEWGASTPFLYFTNHGEELGQRITEGRRRDLMKFGIFEKELALRDFPSPQARETFEQSKLRWDEAERKEHAHCLSLYREALRLRREHSAFRPPDRAQTQVAKLACEVLAIRARNTDEDWLILCDLRGGHRGGTRAEAFCALEGRRQWHCVLSSNSATFGGPNLPAFEPESGKFHFEISETLVLRAE
jgi:maltooligosyltrehalose trehalohydrolase